MDIALQNLEHSLDNAVVVIDRLVAENARLRASLKRADAHMQEAGMRLRKLAEQLPAEPAI
jgi:predicted metallo-beta-lactamase superfamily hydrolase